jgi:phospholipid/cholesterol/gamma-HCH transport system substrate-binding protein
MLSRVVRLQVIVFMVVALIGVGYTGAKYVGLDDLFGGSGYTVKAQLADSGGVFTNAEVTYRGVAIGRIGELRLTRDGVEVDLKIESDAPQVPSDVEAVVSNRSAAGEQYIDLRPRRSGGPFLTAGSVIAQQNTRTPLAVETVLLNLDELVNSLPKDDLRTVVDELYDATEGTAPDLQALLDSSASFTREASKHLPQTTRLITDASTVLKTQLDVSDALKKFGSNAKLIAKALKDADGDLRQILSTAPKAARQVSGLLRETGPNLSALMTHLLTTTTVIGSEINGLEQLLAVSPDVVSAAGKVITNDGANFGLLTTFFEPMPCTYNTRYRNGLETTDVPLNTSARCTR